MDIFTLIFALHWAGCVKSASLLAVARVPNLKTLKHYEETNVMYKKSQKSKINLTIKNAGINATEPNGPESSMNRVLEPFGDKNQNISIRSPPAVPTEYFHTVPSTSYSSRVLVPSAIPRRFCEEWLASILSVCNTLPKRYNTTVKLRLVRSIFDTVLRNPDTDTPAEIQSIPMPIVDESVLLETLRAESQDGFKNATASCTHHRKHRS